METSSSDSIICPYCKHRHSDVEVYGQFVTYWGDDGNWKICECGNCDKEFFVSETVGRDWETFKKETVHNG